MAAPDLEEKALSAGQDYAAAMEKLGFDMQALFWAYDLEIETHVLVLITDFFDHMGPLEISRKLFRAYNLAATPQNIDPFVIRLHSPQQTAAREYLNFVRSGWTIQKVTKAGDREPVDVQAKILSLDTYGLHLRPEWAIRLWPQPKRSSVDISRRWQRFSRNLEKLAA